MVALGVPGRKRIECEVMTNVELVLLVFASVQFVALILTRYYFERRLDIMNEFIMFLYEEYKELRWDDK